VRKDLAIEITVQFNGTSGWNLCRHNNTLNGEFFCRGKPIVAFFVGAALRVFIIMTGFTDHYHDILYS
jgi:hypothetical protein